MNDLALEVTKFNPCHDAKGRFCSASAAPSVPVKIRTVPGPMFKGEPVALKTKPSKLEVGELGEQLVAGFLKAKGKRDVKTLNVKVNNFPVDLAQDHSAIEVKAGLISNGKSAQHWRATIGQPGKAEQAWLKKASKEEKAAWNAKKAEMILARKQKALDQLSKRLGRKVKAKTYGVIINTDKRTADIHEFEGFHLRIPWNSAQAKAGYRGTVKW